MVHKICTIVLLFIVIFLSQERFLKSENDNLCLQSKILFDRKIMDERLMMGKKSLQKVDQFFKAYPFSEPDYQHYFDDEFRRITVSKLENFEGERLDSEAAKKFRDNLENLYKKNEKKIIQRMCDFLPRDENFIYKVLYINAIRNNTFYLENAVFVLDPSLGQWEYGGYFEALEMIIHNAFHVGSEGSSDHPSKPEEDRGYFHWYEFFKREIFFEGIASFVTYQVAGELGFRTNTFYAGGGREYNRKGIGDDTQMRDMIEQVVKEMKQVVKSQKYELFEKFNERKTGKLYMLGAYMFKVINEVEGPGMIRKLLKSNNHDMFFYTYNRLVAKDLQIKLGIDNFR